MLKQRVLTALVLLPLMLVMLFWANEPIWALFVGVITLVALWEYSRLLRFTLKQQVVYTGGTAMFMLMAYVGNWLLPSFVWLAVVAFWLAIMPAWLYQKWELAGAGVRSVLSGWLMMMPFWYGLMYLRPEDGQVLTLLGVMGLVWVADIFAYFFGKMFGSRKLAPSISPGKSWEGAIGGVFAVWVYVSIIRWAGWFGNDTSWFGMMMLATVLTGLSIGGDLLESWFKRSAGVKDSSHLLPGHGGVFDRIDGLVAVVGIYAAWQILLG